MMDFVQMTYYLIIVLAVLLCYFQRAGRSSPSDSDVKIEAMSGSTRQSGVDTKDEEGIDLFKDLYHKLQNLENFPEVLPGARKLLRSIIDQGVLLARYKSPARSILHIEKFDPSKLEQLLAAECKDTMDSWEAYVRRREAGPGRESFVDREAAVNWLKSLAPLNYIDGAWLCRIHKITIPFALRGVTKHAWQTYSEEMGDGDLEKNNVFIYRNLMQEIGAALPAGDSVDFTHPRHGMNDGSAWKGATAQLLVSLFPNDFLPEILGFNLHFEALTTNSLRAMKELAEFGISAYYFTLHISIDNADSGHSAMALATIVQFMDLVRETGMMDYDEAWRHIQAGYLLSQSFDGNETVQMFEAKVADMLQNKASLARKLHCTSRVRIGRRSLSDWFVSGWGNNNNKGNDDNDEDWKHEFLAALADAKPWVHRGNSGKSLLMRELAWKGRMFGAFTDSEIELLRTWIDSLKTGDADSGKPYLAPVEEYKTGKTTFLPSRQDAAVFHPALPPQQERPRSEQCGNELIQRPPIKVSRVRLDVLLPLWFAHPCLLEGTASSPHQMATRLASQILRILLAESSYKLETSGVAGMDEQLFANTSPDLVALGLEIVRRHKLPEPTCLGDVLGEPNVNASDAITFAYTMLSWAMRPMANGMFLLGLARAFLDLEVLVASSDELLARRDREALQQMIERKKVCFEACLNELKPDAHKCREVVAGYEYGRTEIEKVLG